MNEDMVDEPFRSASEKVEAAHQAAVSELKSKVEKAKSDALRKVKP
jgi:hypothetical protein